MSDLKKRLAVVAVATIAIFGGIAFVAYLLRTPAPIAPALIAEVTVPDISPRHVVIGKSVEGRAIDAYTYGTGATRLGFVGGMHGGYEWNSVLLAYTLMDYLSAHPESIPENLSVTVIPDANPDGVYLALGIVGRFTSADVPSGAPRDPERFNAHAVDLNRNFDCNWQATSTWKGKPSSAGTAPFSEPEAKAIKNFVVTNSPKAMVFLHSKSGAVYASECNNGILPTTLEIMKVYARAAGYRSINVFDAYKITGDAEGWLASIGIPAITVELKTHDTIEWEQNLAGIKALFEYYK